jgi:hypothetical protein
MAEIINTPPEVFVFRRGEPGLVGKEFGVGQTRRTRPVKHRTGGSIATLPSLATVMIADMGPVTGRLFRRGVTAWSRYRPRCSTTSYICRFQFFDNEFGKR